MKILKLKWKIIASLDQTLDPKSPVVILQNSLQKEGLRRGSVESERVIGDILAVRKKKGGGKGKTPLTDATANIKNKRAFDLAEEERVRDLKIKYDKEGWPFNPDQGFLDLSLKELKRKDVNVYFLDELGKR